MMSSHVDPVRIYVLWHSDCLLGKEFAKDIYTWFRGVPSDLAQCGYGIPVEYCSDPSAVKLEKRREVELDNAEINVVVPLVDEHMVVDAPWRKYLSDLASESLTMTATSKTVIDQVSSESGIIFCIARHSNLNFTQHLTKT